MRFAFTTILKAPRFGWQAAPSRADRLVLYQAVQKMGFDGVEWSPRWFDVNALTDAEMTLLEDEVAANGLQVSAVNLNRFMLSRCPEAADHRERLRRTVQCAARLGATLIIISLSLPQPPSETRPLLLGQTIPEPEFAEAARCLKRTAQAAGERGVGLVLELHDDGLLDAPELCLRMLDLVDEPNVSLNPDLGNLVRQSRARDSWRDAVSLLAPHAGYWHVKNYRDGKPCPIWDGDIDYPEAIAVMQAAGFDGWVSIESYFGDDVMGLQVQSLNWLRSSLMRVSA